MWNIRDIINLVGEEGAEVSVPCDDEDILGRGQQRTVCNHPKNKNLVIKHALSNTKTQSKDAKIRANVFEYIIYNTLVEKNHPDLEYFAPVVDIANDGTWLTMVKGEPFEPDDDMSVSKKVDWVGDIKYGNFIHVDGKPMISDYATVTAAEALGLPTELDDALKLMKKFKGRKNQY
jgi:hypothetical protein